MSQEGSQAEPDRHLGKEWYRQWEELCKSPEVGVCPWSHSALQPGIQSNDHKLGRATSTLVCCSVIRSRVSVVLEDLL